MGLMFFTNNAKAFANLRTRLASVFECDGPLEFSDISVVLALPLGSQPTVCAVRETVQPHTTARHR
jgi:hypothetical protein